MSIKLKKHAYLSTLTLLTFSLSACSWGGSQVSPTTNTQKTGNELEIISLEKAGVTINDNNKVFVAEVSKNAGASIYFNLVQPKDGFTLKANQDGVPGKKLTDIHHFVIYLVKSSTTSGYPLNGDPLGSSDLVSGPFSLTYDGSGNKVVKFTGIPDSAGKAYYVAIRAQDASNNDLIQSNNGSTTNAWTGTTASTPGVAVSTGNGITVGANLGLNSYTALSVTPNLLNGTGARIDANIAPNPGVVGGSIVVEDIPPNYTYVLSNVVTTSSGFPNSYAGVALDGSGNVLIGDAEDDIVTKYDGSTTSNYGATGLDFPSGLLYKSGILYIASTNNNSIKKFDGTTTTDLGATGLNKPYGIAMDSSGNIYIADTFNNAIKKWDGTTTTTVISTGLNRPFGLAFSSSGDLYIADFNSNSIKKWDGTTTTDSGITGLNKPTGVAFDSSGNLFITDSANNALKKWDGTTVTTVVSSGLAQPYGLTIDSSGNIYIADNGTASIKKATKTIVP